MHERIIVFFQGFDEYMNLVLDDAEEVHLKTKKRRPLGMYWAQLKINMYLNQSKILLSSFVQLNPKVLELHVGYSKKRKKILTIPRDSIYTV